MATEENQQIAEAGPEESKDKPVLTESVATETRIKNLEDGLKSMNYMLDFLKGTNWFILIVLLVGFLTLATALVTGVIQSFNSDRTTQIEFIKSVQQFKDMLPTPTLIPKP